MRRWEREFMVFLGEPWIRSSEEREFGALYCDGHWEWESARYLWNVGRKCI